MTMLMLVLLFYDGVTDFSQAILFTHALSTHRRADNTSTVEDPAKAGL